MRNCREYYCFRDIHEASNDVIMVKRLRETGSCLTDRKKFAKINNSVVNNFHGFMHEQENYHRMATR